MFIIQEVDKSVECLILMRAEPQIIVDMHGEEEFLKTANTMLLSQESEPFTTARKALEIWKSGFDK